MPRRPRSPSQEWTASHNAYDNGKLDGFVWDRTLLILTYDEHGGYYDHVPPPAAIPPDSIGPSLVDPRENPFNGFARYGFRVPFAIVSPWARRHYVSHRVFDHTSVLKLVETKWNLPALTYRDANALPMLDMLDFHQPAFAEPPQLAQPLAVTDPSVLSCSVNGPGTVPPPAPSPRRLRQRMAPRGVRGDWPLRRAGLRGKPDGMSASGSVSAG